MKIYVCLSRPLNLIPLISFSHAILNVFLLFSSKNKGGVGFKMRIITVKIPILIASPPLPSPSPSNQY